VADEERKNTRPWCLKDWLAHGSFIMAIIFAVFGAYKQWVLTVDKVSGNTAGRGYAYADEVDKKFESIQMKIDSIDKKLETKFEKMDDKMDELRSSFWRSRSSNNQGNINQ